MHPWLQRRELCAYCAAHGIIVEAYSPLAKAEGLTDPVLVALAKAHGTTPAQALLQWSLAKGFVTLPKSVSRERQAENLAALTGPLPPLSAEDVAVLDGMESGWITGWDPVTTDPV